MSDTLKRIWAGPVVRTLVRAAAVSYLTIIVLFVVVATAASVWTDPVLVLLWAAWMASVFVSFYILATVAPAGKTRSGQDA